MTILFTGGGTLGPVTPLLAVLRQMLKRRPELVMVWAGTPQGPERAVIEKEGIPFYAVPVAKLPRYPSWRWLTWPVALSRARLTAERIVRQIQPALVVSAGGFTSVPVIKAARRRKIPCAIHQLDAEPGLANRAVARHCQSVTSSFKYDFEPFEGVKILQAPTPCRFAGVTVSNKNEAAFFFGLDAARPIILVMGGGTGASYLNQAVWKIKSELLAVTQVIHLTGRNKGRETGTSVGYEAREFFDEKNILQAYAAADLVISRAGLGAIADLICLKKPAILVPIPKTHQMANVRRLPFAVVEQGRNFEEQLLRWVKIFLENNEMRQRLIAQISAALPVDDGSALAERWLKLLKT